LATAKGLDNVLTADSTVLPEKILRLYHAGDYCSTDHGGVLAGLDLPRSTGILYNGLEIKFLV